MTNTTTKKQKKEGSSFDLLTRENIEALTMAIIMAVMLKYFVVEAYKIPTGSMQPTLMGNDETGIFDRILVDKFSYHYRDPERFEVAVFKYPLDQSKNFIKRIVGMPGEELQIRDGDVFTRANEKEEWKVLRRPRPVQLETWKRILPQDPRFAAWSVVEGAREWRVQGRATITARGDGAVRLPVDGGTVFDSYRDGYPEKVGALVHTGPEQETRNPVGDLRVTGQIKALAGCKLVTIELREGEQRHRLQIPGPAAAGDARPHITSESTIGRTSPVEAHTSKAWKLTAGESVSFAAQNMDDQLQLEIDGEIVLTVDIPFASDQRSNFVIRVEGEGADLSDVEVWRDIFYTERLRTAFTIPPGCYVMLGDNTQNSSDCREWMFAQYRWPGPGSQGELVRGNKWSSQRNPNEGNPVKVAEGPGRTRVFFRDEWGNRHDFLMQPDSQGPDLPAAYVPRNLITGRAVAVFWPINKLTARLKWIR